MPDHPHIHEKHRDGFILYARPSRSPLGPRKKIPTSSRCSQDIRISGHKLLERSQAAPTMLVRNDTVKR